MHEPSPLWRTVLAMPVLCWTALLPANGAAESGDRFEDPRDGKAYRTVEIGGMTWLAENLAYETTGSYCYDDEAERCASDGRLYKWEVALAACPPGWHLATEYEWQELELALGLPFRQLLYQRERGTNEGLKLLKGGSAGFDAVLAGWRTKGGAYHQRGGAAAFWVADDADMDHAWHRDLRADRPTIWRSRVYKPYALSVRCVKHRLIEDEPDEE